MNTKNEFNRQYFEGGLDYFLIMSIKAVAQTSLDAAIGAHDASSVIALLTSAEIPSWNSLYNIGQRFFSEGHYAEASKLLEKALEIAPDATSTLLSVQYLSGCYFALNKYTSEQDCIRKELAILKQNYHKNLPSIIDLTKALGLSYFRAGKLVDASCSFNEAITMTRQISIHTIVEAELVILMQRCHEIKAQ